MKLKSLELFGFKSFVDKTVIHFQEGITGIVGPNGTGKSNCVDALRWAMGEQSAKHLRGSEMQDVIFNGTSARPPLGMSQVILTFDLTDGRAPAGFTDYAEAQIERRLYRSGESEYYINKIPCRLRDIIDFFLGTGVGTKAYSIIEQGRIGSILSAKPEERRFLIEEAAGISKFKNRKEAALRRIEWASSNLARLGDIIAEIKRQLNSLDRQARKAERYKKLYEELKDKELKLSYVGYLKGRASVEHCEVEGVDLSSSEASLLASLSKLEAECEKERLMMAALEQELNSVQEKFYIQKNAVKLHETTMEYQASKVKDIEHQAETDTDEIATFKAKLKRCEEEIERLNQIKFSLDVSRVQASENIGQMETALLNQVLPICSEWQAKTEEVSRAILKCVSEVAESQSCLEYLERREVELEGRIAKGEAETDAIDRVQKDLEKKIAHSDKDCEDLKQLSFRLTDEKTSVRKNLNEKRAMLETAVKDLEALKTEWATRQSQLASLETLHKNMEGFREGVRTVLKASKEGLEGILGPVSDAVDTVPQFEAAVVACLGEKLQYVVVQSQQEGLSAMEYLKVQAKGRSTFIPLNVKSQTSKQETLEGPGVIGPLLENVRFADDYRRIAQYLFGNCVLVEDLKKALELWRQGSQEKTLVTLQGEVVDASGVISGGASLEGESLLGHKRRIEGLQKEVALSKAKATETESEVWRLKSQMQSLEERYEVLNRDSHGEEIRLVQQEKDGLRLREELVRFHQDRDRLSLEIAEGLDEKRGLNQEKETVVCLLEERVTTQQLLEKDLTEYQVKLSQATEEKNRFGESLTQAKALWTQGLDKSHATDREITQWIQTKLECKEGIEKRIVELNQGSQTLKQLEEAQISERTELEKALIEMEASHQRQKELKARYESMSKQTRDLELELREIRRRHEEMVKAAHANELKLTEVRNQFQFLRDQVLERYKVDISHYSPSQGIPDDFNLESEMAMVADLKDKLEKLGSVHVGAIEEYDELKQRFEFLSKQQEDLIRSLEGLKKAIQKINRISRERFLKTFELVNEKFQEVFPRLFKGGRAKLLLMDEENLLESGVEIFAQPPGKKLQSITLLSGGEKALTAVALIFSIFLIKPSPFCLLDEVDAPLDDANIDRFNELVREMTSQAQFIIITHNKRTMEKTDCLYGITMEEAGVSKVVSVRLKQNLEEPEAKVA